MRSLESPQQNLIEEINRDLEKPEASLASILRKAARLAGLCGEIEYRMLFGLHLDGAVPIAGTRIEKWPDPQKYPKWNIVEAFTEDRTVESGKTNGAPLEQMELFPKRVAQVRELAAKDNEHQYMALDSMMRSKMALNSLMKSEIENSVIFSRIRNRVTTFVRTVECGIYEEQLKNKVANAHSGQKIFIGHGQSPIWKDLKELIQNRLKLIPDEFNLESSAGKATVERLREMLDDAGFAFLIMTAEDEHADKTLHARENVIHEIGLFQGRLGFKRAIILLEDNCKEFGNIIGLTEIRFPKGDIMAKSEEIRSVLEREGFTKPVT